MLSRKQIHAYRENGFLVLRAFISRDEIDRLRKAVDRMVAGAPVKRGAEHDSLDRPVNHPKDFSFTIRNRGRHVLNRISAPLSHSMTMLRAYGNPKLLGAVENLYGPDFVPFAESIVIKLPENGAAFAWHQDGNFKTGVQRERGVNFGIYLYRSTEENGCLYVIPQSHKLGKVDLKTMVETHGQHLPGAIPVPAMPGDVVVHSRNLVHGSFTNPSKALRVTVYFGYHVRQTVEGAFTPEHIEKRAKVIPLSVRVRAESGLFPGETRYCYQALQTDRPFALTEQAELLRTPPLAL